MPTQIANFDFFPLQFDVNGNLTDSTQLTALTSAAATATDVALIAHGFRNDENDATTLYTNFLTSLRTHVTRPELKSLPGRKLIIAGVYWPAKAYPENFVSAAAAATGTVQDIDATAPALADARAQLEELQADATQEQKHVLSQAIDLLPTLDANPALQDRFATLVLSILAPADDLADPTEGLGMIRSTAGSDLLQMLQRPLVAPIARGAAASNVETIDDFEVPSDSGEAQDVSSVVDSVLGAAGKLANLTTWYQMKTRSGLVGETGVARVVRALKTSPLTAKVHLIGHSLGGRLMAACGRALTQAPAVHPDSMNLLEAAFSHFGFSPNNGKGETGFFRDVIGKKLVSGPLIETFSAQDTVVGYVYAIASRLANDNVKAIGDATDPFGGIGRNGAQATPESNSEILHDAGTPYTYRLGMVNNLDGSGGLITNHSDVTNDRVTYAVACAINAA